MRIKRLVRRGKTQVTEILKEASIQTYVNEFKIDSNDGVCPLSQTEQKKREKLKFLSFLRGGYLLSHLRSTIGVVRFNFSVRDGKRWSPDAIAT